MELLFLKWPAELLQAKGALQYRKNEYLVKALIAEIQGDADEFYSKANSAAGTRLRKGMQDLKVLATEIRKEVTEKKNSK